MEKTSDTRQIRCPKCKEFYEFFIGPPRACPDCMAKREAQIEHVRKLIRGNRGITVMELQRQTGVPTSFIMKMLEDGEVEKFSENVSFNGKIL
ncbi:MAG: hypothetical protein FWF80_08350 [Defluviitaleaceae bacterium]|nr:hypothetical protein [Defluviitaleaceae bacterium]